MSFFSRSLYTFIGIRMQGFYQMKLVGISRLGANGVLERRKIPLLYLVSGASYDALALGVSSYL